MRAGLACGLPRFCSDASVGTSRGSDFMPRLPFWQARGVWTCKAPHCKHGSARTSCIQSFWKGASPHPIGAAPPPRLLLAVSCRLAAAAAAAPLPALLLAKTRNGRPQEVCRDWGGSGGPAGRPAAQARR